ncbi:hypothetical protein FACS189487_07550 [Campylobacterota bacterium]|nr:hypothetical protein FACS189487_07550 [Campylobacterota bacterium]
MIIVYHIETTGLSRLEDEILSLSIINGEGVVLFDELIKPRIKQEWWHAQAINGISPSSVKDKRTISEHLDTIQDLFDQADELIAYNPEFENAFLEEAGIIFPERATFNVMDEFAVRSAKWNKSHGSYTRQKLSTCAEYYGYKADIRTGLGKVKATLHCYQRQTANYLQP